LESNIEDIAAGNSNLISNKPQSGNRTLFYSMLAKDAKSAFVDLCTVKPPTFLDRLKKKIRSLVIKNTGK